MKNNNCNKEKCPFYTPYSECSYDGCMFGASTEDKEENRSCAKNKTDQKQTKESN